jgi:hypothetical protein
MSKSLWNVDKISPHIARAIIEPDSFFFSLDFFFFLLAVPHTFLPKTTKFDAVFVMRRVWRSNN